MTNLVSAIIVLGYIFVMVLIGVLMYKFRKPGPEDYYLMSRGISWWLLPMTTLATMISTFTFLGAVGLGYSIGTSMFFSSLSNAWFGMYMITIGYRLWLLGRKYRYVSLGEIIYDRFGESKFLEIFFGVATTLSQLAYLAMMYVGCTWAISTITGGMISYKWALLVIVVSTSVYTLVGGMRAVVVTDAIQWVMIVITLVGIAVIIVGFGATGAGAIDGIHVVVKQAPRILGKAMPDKMWMDMFVLISLGLFFTPQIWTRMFAARDEKALAWTAANVAFFPPLFSAGCAFLIAMTAWAIYGANFPKPDNILPSLLKDKFPWWYGPIVMAGAVAAAQSTISSLMLGISQVITRDIVRPLKRELTSRQSDHVSYIVIAALGIVSIAIGWLPPQSIIIKTVEFSNSGIAMIAPVAFAAMYWRRATKQGAIAGFVVGFIGAVIVRFFNVQTPWITGTLWSLLINIVLIIVVSYLTPKPSAEKVEKVIGYPDSVIYQKKLALTTP